VVPYSVRAEAEVIMHLLRGDLTERRLPAAPRAPTS
jgi:hypothetical protein